MTSPAPDPDPLNHSLHIPRSVMLLSVLLLTATTPLAFAGSATWKTDPISNDWNSPANWTPETVPNGPTDVATFEVSNQTAVSLSANTEVAEIVFNPLASNFTISSGPATTLTISGVGITNNSNIEQNVVLATDATGAGALSFTHAATAGDQVSYTVNGTNGAGGALLSFHDTSTAGTASFTTNGGAAYLGGFGMIQFDDSSTAAHGRFINNGSTVFASGQTFFYNNSNAGNATFTNRGARREGIYAGGVGFFDFTSAANSTIINEGTVVAQAGITYFYGDSTAENALFILTPSRSRFVSLSELGFTERSTAGNATIRVEKAQNGLYEGKVLFFDESDGGTSRIELFGSSGFVELFGPTTIGSIQGYGFVNNSTYSLILGSNNLDTVFSGVITGVGSLTKIGKGRLVLARANLYTGGNDPVAGTIITQGTLLVNNISGSGTGTGSVLVRGGTLSGTGIIAGPVTVGDGKGQAAQLTPGNSKTPPASLTLQSNVSFTSDGVLRIPANSDTGSTGTLIANGVTINGGQFSISDDSSSVLPIGTVLTPINNTAATPISGTFSNLPDGGTITVGSNTFQASYEGGDGNDLTLTVVL